MEFLDNIIECERKYLKLTSKIDDHGNHIHFTDFETPDIPMQNYTYIKRNTTFEELRALIEEERTRLLDENLLYIRLVFDPIIPYSAEMPDLSDFSFNTYNIFTLNLDNVDNDFAHQNCYPAKSEDYSKLKYYYNSLIEQNSDYDTHIDRWIQIKLKEENIQTIVFEQNGDIVGSCELFIDNDLVKIEDLEVLEAFRNRGIGFALLQSAISIAKSKNVKNLYLISEFENDVTSYYLKRGFLCYTDYNSCTLYRN